MTSPKKNKTMPFNDFLNDDEFGNLDSWADDDFDISLVAPVDDVPLPVIRDPPFMVKMSNLDPDFQDSHLKTLFQYYLDIFTQLPAFFENHKRQFERDLKYVPGRGIRIKKFKIFNDIASGTTTGKKVAFVEFENLVDLNVVLLWNDLNLLNKELFNFCQILESNGDIAKNYRFEALLFKKKNSSDKINFKLADFFDFKKYTSANMNGRISSQAEASSPVMKKSLNSRSLRFAPSFSSRLSNDFDNDIPAVKIPPHPTVRKTNPFGNAKPVEISPEQPQQQSAPIVKKKLNPFGNAKPVDVLSKQMELEKKLEKFAIDDTTFHLHGGKNHGKMADRRKSHKQHGGQNESKKSAESTSNVKSPAIQKNDPSLSSLIDSSSFYKRNAKDNNINKNNDDFGNNDDYDLRSSISNNSSSASIQKKYSASFVQPNISYSSILRDPNSETKSASDLQSVQDGSSASLLIEKLLDSNPDEASPIINDDTMVSNNSRTIEQETLNEKRPVIKDAEIVIKNNNSKKIATNIQQKPDKEKDINKRNHNRNGSTRRRSHDSDITFHKSKDKLHEISFLPPRPHLKNDRNTTRRHRNSDSHQQNSISFRPSQLDSKPAPVVQDTPLSKNTSGNNNSGTGNNRDSRNAMSAENAINIEQGEDAISFTKRKSAVSKGKNFASRSYRSRPGKQNVSSPSHDSSSSKNRDASGTESDTTTNDSGSQPIVYSELTIPYHASSQSSERRNSHHHSTRMHYPRASRSNFRGNGSGRSRYRRSEDSHLAKMRTPVAKEENLTLE